MDEIVELTERDRQHQHDHKLMVIDVGDIFDEMEEIIRLAGEVPIHNRYHENTGWFVEEIYNSICYLPRLDRAAVANIENVLAACGTYFDHYAFTPLQRELWYQLAYQLVDRFQTFKLYNQRCENMYDYHALHGDALILKLFE